MSGNILKGCCNLLNNVKAVNISSILKFPLKCLYKPILNSEVITGPVH